MRKNKRIKKPRKPFHPYAYWVDYIDHGDHLEIIGKPTKVTIQAMVQRGHEQGDKMLVDATLKRKIKAVLGDARSSPDGKMVDKLGRKRSPHFATYDGSERRVIRHNKDVAESRDHSMLKHILADHCEMGEVEKQYPGSDFKADAYGIYRGVRYWFEIVWSSRLSKEKASWLVGNFLLGRLHQKETVLYIDLDSRMVKRRIYEFYDAFGNDGILESDREMLEKSLLDLMLNESGDYKDLVNGQISLIGGVR